MTAPHETARNLSGLDGIVHGFFGRRGGMSTGAFASLNVSESAGDNVDTVADNRAVVANRLGFTPLTLATLKQTHSNRVQTLTETPLLGERPDADAMVTALPGMLLGILTADCTPILFADQDAGVIGAAHAGWKGAVDGIITNTVAAMVALGARPERIVAAIGPTISVINYEVGPEFEADFLARHPGSAACFITPEGGKAHFDLPGFVAGQLRQAGLVQVQDLDVCTYGAPDRYFSHRWATHRRQTTGRQIAVIGRV